MIDRSVALKDVCLAAIVGAFSNRLEG